MTTKHSERLAEAKTRFEPAVRTTTAGLFYGVVYSETGKEVWYDQTQHANRMAAFSRATREADLKAEELVYDWEDAAEAERRGDGSCGACGGLGAPGCRCGNTGRERTRSPLMDLIVDICRDGALAAAKGGAL